MTAMVRLFLHLLAFFALGLTAACDRAPAPQPEAQGGPALWRVERGAFKGWLFGTIHVLPSGIAWDTPPIRNAMAQPTG